MSSLRDLQLRFAQAMLGDPDVGLVDAIAGDGLLPAARLRIYAHHVLSTLTDVLATTFPVVCRLVDRRFFAYAADSHIRAYPPTAPCLIEYGETFADFLAAFPACRHLEYLPDVARLEWAIHRALHADHRAMLDPSQLSGMATDALAQARLALHPSLSLLASPFPVDRIWRANQPDADGRVRLDVGGVRLEVRRVGEDAVFRTLAAGDYALRAGLARGAPLQQALEAAHEADPGAEIAPMIQRLLSDDLVTAICAGEAAPAEARA